MKQLYTACASMLLMLIILVSHSFAGLSPSDIPAGLDPGAILNAERFNASQKGLFYGNLESMLKPPEPVIIDEEGLLPKDLRLNGVIIPDEEMLKP